MCDLQLNSAFGVIASPNYPGHYPHKLKCVWLIDLGPGYDVTVVFWDFDVEESKKCNFDYVMVQDGKEVDSTIIGQFCSSTVPPAQRTKGPMRISFVTDGDRHLTGFTTTYTAKGWYSLEYP